MNAILTLHAVAATTLGVRPSLPGPLARSRWWTQPIRAEVYALLRIGVAVALLLDQCLTMLPHLDVLFGEGSSGAPHLFGWMFQRPQLHWSLLAGVADLRAIALLFYLWMAATAGLLVGWNTRLCSIAVWVLAVSFTNLNTYAINAGDHIRGMLLLYLMLVPCGAAWSIDAWLGSLRTASPRQAHPWALRLLLIQLAWMYCSSGLCKLSGYNWPVGNSLYYVMHDLSLTRFSADMLPMPYWMTQLATWSVLAWEVTFPVLLLFRKTRLPALLFGVAMHLGIFITMELGCFPLYLLAAYAALLWEMAAGRVPAPANE